MSRKFCQIAPQNKDIHFGSVTKVVILVDVVRLKHGRKKISFY
jgi:hypothetical protein